MPDILDQGTFGHLEYTGSSAAPQSASLLPTDTNPESCGPENYVGDGSESSANDDSSTDYDSLIEADTWEQSLTRIDDEDWEIADRGT